RVSLVPLKAHVFGPGLLGDSLQVRRGKLPASCRIAIKLGSLRRRDEVNFRKATNETDVVLERFPGNGTGFGRFCRRPVSIVTRRIGTGLEVDSVPELLVNKLARMVIDADDAPTLGQ